MQEDKIFIKVLGAAAGGGFPQWNCNCNNCVAARQKLKGYPPQTQSSIAVSVDGLDWALFNASPDLRQQINSNPELWPASPEKVGKRHSPIQSVLVTNGDIDHILGLLTLREKQEFTLFATSKINEILEDNPLFKALDPNFVSKKNLVLEQPIEILPSLFITLFSVPGKVPLYMESGDVVTDEESENTVGVEIRRGNKVFYYIPGCAKLTQTIADRIDNANLLFFDGTLWCDDEMILNGTGEKTGLRMGHMSIFEETGSIAMLKKLKIAQKFYIHINNTNPILNQHSKERKYVEQQGWNVAFDGMDLCI